VRDPLDDLDRAVLADLGGTGWGAPPDGLWPTSREAARRRLDHAIGVVLPRFGPHQDAMLTGSWQMAHTLLSPALNLGWLHPREVCDAIEDAYRAGAVPVASAEGLLRQVLGWREYVWGLYWLWMPGWRDANELGASRPLPPAFTGAAPTRMACLAEALEGVRARAWVHHIQRLMVLGNLCLLAGVRPAELVEWMWASFVDGAEWVMLPNVVGMALYADGGRMATKPYASGGAYLNRMGDACGRCPYDPRRRTGPDACPYTTLYWDFLARHAGRLAAEPRVAPQVRAAPARPDLPAIRARAAEVLDLLDSGEL
jgi:deoxyribodipyrimidine photolyase-related protein